jgi:hypothetical protein
VAGGHDSPACVSPPRATRTASLAELGIVANGSIGRRDVVEVNVHVHERTIKNASVSLEFDPLVAVVALYHDAVRGASTASIGEIKDSSAVTSAIVATAGRIFCNQRPFSRSYNNRNGMLFNKDLQAIVANASFLLTVVPHATE